MTKFLLILALIVVGAAAATLSILHFPRAQRVVQHAVKPGALSQPHAFLENNCAACHTAVKGVEAKSCVVCHADNKSLLQRQPSAFHADIASCTACHVEHQGRVPGTTKMDHVALAKIGLRQMPPEPPAPDKTRGDFVAWLVKGASGPPPSSTPQLQREEALLNCATCHQTKDRHVGMLGNDCAQCHATVKWTIPEFRHPSPISQSCAQCHRAPPSHYMMHFKMVSMTVAKMEKAEVSQCFLCHQTTSWNDIQGVGFYKHH
ncbi:MAG TPA: hypothetical protein VHO24_04560 [Opitutaceae bacterium]|nr:hypothetical protein [Opitutaceae bacterium]